MAILPRAGVMAYSDDDHRNLLVEPIVVDICDVLGPLEDQCLGWPVETVQVSAD